MEALITLAIIAAVIFFFWGGVKVLLRQRRIRLDISRQRHFVAEGTFDRAETRSITMPMGLPAVYLTKIFFTDGRHCLINGRLGQSLDYGTLIQVWRRGRDEFFVEAIEPEEISDA